MDSVDTIRPDLGAAAVRDGDLAVMVEALDADLRRMAGKRLLVTGGAGFLGYYLIQVPVAWNDAHPGEPPIQVTVFDNYFRGVPGWLEELGAPARRRAGRPRHAGTAARRTWATSPYVVHAAGIASPDLLPGASHRDDGRQHQRPAEPARLRPRAPGGGPAAGGLPLLLVQRDLRRPGAPTPSPPPRPTAATSPAPGPGPATTSRSGTARRCASTSPASTASRSPWCAPSTTTARG